MSSRESIEKTYLARIDKLDKWVKVYLEEYFDNGYKVIDIKHINDKYGNISSIIITYNIENKEYKAAFDSFDLLSSMEDSIININWAGFVKSMLNKDLRKYYNGEYLQYIHKQGKNMIANGLKLIKHKESNQSIENGYKLKEYGESLVKDANQYLIAMDEESKKVEAFIMKKRIEEWKEKGKDINKISQAKKFR